MTTAQETQHPDWRPFQLELKDDPFWMLVACILVNRTRWSVAKHVLAAIREEYIHPLGVAYANDLEDLLEPLGFSKKRASNLRELAWRFCGVDHMIPRTSLDVTTLPGCGRYAADSWAIFIEGRTDVEPTDEALKAWLTMVRRGLA